MLKELVTEVNSKLTIKVEDKIVKKLTEEEETQLNEKILNYVCSVTDHKDLRKFAKQKNILPEIQDAVIDRYPYSRYLNHNLWRAISDIKTSEKEAKEKKESFNTFNQHFIALKHEAVLKDVTYALQNLKSTSIKLLQEKNINSFKPDKETIDRIINKLKKYCACLVNSKLKILKKYDIMFSTEDVVNDLLVILLRVINTYTDWEDGGEEKLVNYLKKVIFSNVMDMLTDNCNENSRIEKKDNISCPVCGGTHYKVKNWDVGVFQCKSINSNHKVCGTFYSLTKNKLICPKCNSNKFKKIANNTYRCTATNKLGICKTEIEDTTKPCPTCGSTNFKKCGNIYKCNNKVENKRCNEDIIVKNTAILCQCGSRDINVISYKHGEYKCNKCSSNIYIDNNYQMKILSLDFETEDGLPVFDLMTYQPSCEKKVENSDFIDKLYYELDDDPTLKRLVEILLYNDDNEFKIWYNEHYKDVKYRQEYYKPYKKTLFLYATSFLELDIKKTFYLITNAFKKLGVPYKLAKVNNGL